MDKSRMKKYDIINPVWENESKTQIKCQIVMTNSDETVTKHLAIVNQGSNDWDLVVEKYGLDKIDEMTDELNSTIDEKRKEQREKSREDHLRSKERARLEKLFTRKLEIFEIEEVKNSEDKEAKAKIRKSNNETEALVYAAMLVMQESK
jgi:hypothetical protein